MRSEPLANEPVANEAFAGETSKTSPGEAALGGLPPDEALEAAVPAFETAAAEPAAPEPTREATEAQEALEAQDAKDEAREAYEAPAGDIEMAPPPEGGEDHGETGDHLAPDAQSARSDEHGEHAEHGEPSEGHGHNGQDSGHNGDDHHEEEHVETVGGADALEEVQQRSARVHPRQYKIQEVIKRRQVMLVQVVKEERGSKGAALTTYLSPVSYTHLTLPTNREV